MDSCRRSGSTAIKDIYVLRMAVDIREEAVVYKCGMGLNVKKGGVHIRPGYRSSYSGFAERLMYHGKFNHIPERDLASFVLRNKDSVYLKLSASNWQSKYKVSLAWKC